jgi:hypothetical protein
MLDGDPLFTAPEPACLMCGWRRTRRLVQPTREDRLAKYLDQPAPR